MLKVSPWKGVIRFSKRGKLNPLYIGPFKILAKVGTVAYRLELPEKLKPDFMEYLLWSQTLIMHFRQPLVYSLMKTTSDDKLNFNCKNAIKIMVRAEVKRLKQSPIPIVEVPWNSERFPSILEGRREDPNA
ncbi:hypothetical protein Tco_0031092 [Tanacetum coccineum]